MQGVIVPKGADMKRMYTGAALAAAASFALPAVAFAEEGGSSDGVALLIPKPAEFVPALVIFLVIWFLLAKFVWPRVIAALDARQKHIEDAIEEADETKAQAEELHDQADQAVIDAHRQASEIVMAARNDAEEVRAQIIAKARVEAEDIILKAREHAASEQRLMYDHATDSIAKVSVAVASKIVDEKLSTDQDLQYKIIKKYLAEVGNLND